MPIKFIIFFAFLPAIAAGAHDLFLFFDNPANGLMLSNLGWIWTTYHPESYRWAMDTLDPMITDTLKAFISLKSVIAGAVFGAILLPLGLFLALVKFLLSFGFVARRKSKQSDLDYIRGGKKTEFKYKYKD